MSLRHYIVRQMHRREQLLRVFAPPGLPPEMATRRNRTRQRINDRAERIYLRADTANGWD
ncbi:hypothetical protein LQR31_21000 [Chromobacterium vaccinii]|uniref:hypothetical protein n=1 Tax=Chromobacterium vaccinii TaxID=1108595 RepID=UPI000AF987AD|nr:hypothetical protein [Chromobacterium vaccinii]MCD4486954.1 hypothetical protein [Chromobacterium vaccinii]NHQ81142.1 hypothetical protein [Chromobacterium vaccinii]SUX53886.1 Uncharacterised protein [Chromobacterium vaccinii]